jgi:hypothetical protein
MAERLDKLSAIRTEMAAIYRQMKGGKIESQEATRRVYVLKEIRCCIEAEMLVKLEERMVKIQEATAPRVIGSPLSSNMAGSSLVTVPARLS